MLKKIGLALVVLVAALLAFATTKPDTMVVERSTTVHASPEKLFAYIDDFHRWSAWSPYEKLDPAMKRSYAGAPAGPGAVYEWAGNGDVGQGRMEITEASPALVAIKLDFLKPMAAHNVTEFKLQPIGDSTRVTWSMRGPNMYIGKVMSIFVDMDHMIGKDFETGLANLKTVAER